MVHGDFFQQIPIVYSQLLAREEHAVHSPFVWNYLNQGTITKPHVTLCTEYGLNELILYMSVQEVTHPLHYEVSRVCCAGTQAKCPARHPPENASEIHGTQKFIDTLKPKTPHNFTQQLDKNDRAQLSAWYV